MNYLGHAVLSGADEAILVGNFIGDFVKGKSWQNYPESIGRGILLHRAIDQFTDEHPAVRRMVAVFREAAGRYAPPAVDIACDYFLAKHFSEFGPTDLQEFSARVYAVLRRHREHLPPDFKFMLGYMQRDDWLYNYQKIEGIRRTYNGLHRRRNFPKAELLIPVLEAKEAELLTEFRVFFKEISIFAAAQSA